MSRGDGFEVAIDLFGPNEATLWVGYLPMRKSVCLTLVNGSVHDTVAYFRNEEDAVKFIEHITGEVVEFKDSPDGH